MIPMKDKQVMIYIDREDDIVVGVAESLDEQML